jgi:hypothetical protein
MSESKPSSEDQAAAAPARRTHPAELAVALGVLLMAVGTGMHDVAAGVLVLGIWLVIIGGRALKGGL